MKNFTYDIEKDYSPFILSAVIGADSFFYGIFDKEFSLYSCEYFDGVNFDGEFQEYIASKLSLYTNTKQKIAFSTKPFLHAPVGESEIIKYYPAFDDKKLIAQSLSSDEAQVLYGLKNSHIKFLDQCFNKPEMRHLSAVLSQDQLDNRNSKILLHFDESNMHIIAVKDGKFEFYNQFHCMTAPDYLYYATMAFDLIGADVEEDTVTLSGRIGVQSEVYDLLHGYIRNIKFADPAKLEIEDLRFMYAKQFYYDLYTTAICE